jgi:transcriptional regulator with XRE-family HTH domain
MATKKKATKRTKLPGIEAGAFLERYLGGPLTFGDMLHAIRVGEEQSLTAFGQKLGLTPAKLCDIEKGRRTVGPARAAAWARTLGYSEQQFVRLAVQQQLDEEGLGHLHVQIASA